MRAFAIVAVVAAASCAAPPPPPITEARDTPAADPIQVLAAIISRDRDDLMELASTYRIEPCGTRGRQYETCVQGLLRVAARRRGLDPGAKSLFETFARPDSWSTGRGAVRALTAAMQAQGPASVAADALIVARSNLVLDAVEAAADENRALLFSMGIGLPCPAVMTELASTAPEHRRAKLIEAGCIAASDESATESPEGLAARGALESLDGARRRVRSAGGALADALLTGFEPALRNVRIPIPLPTTMSVRGSTLSLPEAEGDLDWVAPMAVLTVSRDGLNLAEPPWLGVGPRGPARLGTVLPGPRTTAAALADDLVQVMAALPPSASGDSGSGLVLVVADAREPASHVAAALASLAALPDAPRVAIAVRARGRQAQIELVDTREPATAVNLRLVIGAGSAMVVASGIGLPADRDVAALGRRLDEVRQTFPAEQAITLVPGADVTLSRLVEVLRVTATRRFSVLRIANLSPGAN